MSLAAGLKKSRNRNAEKAAVVFGEKSWTYAEFDDLTDNLAKNLFGAGLEPGDRIAFHLLNGLDLALGYVGCLKAGCIAVPINTRLKGPEIDYILRHSGSMCYVGQPDLHMEAAKSCPAIADLALRYLTGGSIDNRTGAFDDLLHSPIGAFSLPGIAPDQAAAIVYTSGTTARPKGVTHSHKTLNEIVRAMRSTCLDEDHVVVVMSSMAHLIGYGMMFLAGLLNGATIVITRPFDFESVLNAFARWGKTYTAGLP